MKKTFLILFFILFLPINVLAADLFWEKNNQDVCLKINTEQESVNAFSGVVEIDNSQKWEFSEAGSIINFWLKKPNNTNTEISGIIPGGFLGKAGILGCFKINEDKNFSITVKNSEVFLNDGFGTKVSLPEKKYNFIFVEQKENQVVPVVSTTIRDIYPPEDFPILLSKSEDLFDNQNFIAFATEDKLSGIDHYEILETKLVWTKKDGTKFPLKLGGWQKVESPFQISDQDLSSYVFVRAIDKSGNVREVYLEPILKIEWYQNKLILFGLLIGAIIILGLIYKRKRHE